ncbi:MAG: hypothetical protein V4723_00505 [Pseudomonadota bacterium]
MIGRQQLEEAPPLRCSLASVVDVSDSQDLVVGVADIPEKERLVLRSLLKVMDGKDHLRLRFSDELTECNIVLMSIGSLSRLPTGCVAVYLIPEGQGETPLHPGLSIRAPLRLSNTSLLLQAAAELLTHAEVHSASGSLAPLLSVLLRKLMSRERRTTVLPLGEDQEIIVDFLEDRYHCRLPLEALFEGQFDLQESRRANEGEIASIALQPGARLREFLWQATNRLVDVAAPCDTLSGNFRLHRWPDAMGLSRPGFPMLAALLTNRPHSVAQASKASGASPAAVSWFLRTNLALGIAELVDMAEHSAPSAEPIIVHAAPASSMLSRIRDRLKLW